jgi:hypothetical protein
MSGTDTERILDAYLAPEADRLPDRVIDAALADIARTQQRRASRAPWRFHFMPDLPRVTGIAAVAIVAVVGVGTLAYLTSNRPTGTGSQSTSAPTTAPTQAPTVAPSPESSFVAPGITGWKTYRSAIGRTGYSIGYPDDWSVNSRATREWRAGDVFPADELPYAESFVSPGADDAVIGLLVWEAPEGEGFDIETIGGLKAWATDFCGDVAAPSCEASVPQAQTMCLDEEYFGDACGAAILVPTPDLQYAFFIDWRSFIFGPDQVRVVVVAREDDFPPAARYGGSVELLKSILTTMNVWTPGQQPAEGT